MKRATAWLALPLLWLATALRFGRLDAQSFWNDEGNSARLAERSLRLIVEGAAADVHPPLYYLLLAGWRQLLGDGEFALRALSAFAGVLLVAGVLALGRSRGERRGLRLAALAGGLLAAVHPALVYYSQEARMYALLGLWAVLSTALLWRLLPKLARRHAAGVRQAAPWAVGYVATVSAGLYTHYFFPVVLLGHGAAVALHMWQGRGSMRRRVDVGAAVRWAALVASALLLYAPWAPIFLRQTGGRAIAGVTLATFGRDAARWLALGETASTGLWLPMATLWGLALVGAVARRGLAGVAAVHVVAAPLLMALAGTMRPAYYKFLIIAAPFVALLAGYGVAVLWQGMQKREQAPSPWLTRLAASALLGLALWGSGQSLWNLYDDDAYARADYRAMAAQIAAEAHPNAGVILNAANQWEVFTYYHRAGAPVYPIPRGQPQEAQIAQELAQIAARHERLYALFWGEAERDPQRLVERWLDANSFKAREAWVGDVRFVTYAVPQEPSSSMAVEAGVSFGEHITLQGYTLQGGVGDSVTAAAGDILQVTLFWQSNEPLQTRYKVFLHLLDLSGGPPLAQRDAEPVGNLAPTTTWQAGEQVIDNHGLLLPADLPPGQYSLRVGLYDFADAALRLPVSAQGQASGDSFLLGTVTVR